MRYDAGAKGASEAYPLPKISFQVRKAAPTASRTFFFINQFTYQAQKNRCFWLRAKKHGVSEALGSVGNISSLPTICSLERISLNCGSISYGRMRGVSKPNICTLCQLWFESQENLVFTILTHSRIKNHLKTFKIERVQIYKESICTALEFGKFLRNSIIIWILVTVW